MGKCGEWRIRSYHLLIVYLIGLMIFSVRGDLKADGEALLGFLQGLAVAPKGMNWSNSTSPCTWLGVKCNLAQDSVESLKLPGTGLYGNIRQGTLGALSKLQILSLRSNHLSGSLPYDLTNCTQVRKIFLQHNLFSGPILPFDRVNTPALSTIDLSFNVLEGDIPPSLTSLSLRIILLQNNSLSGSIPQNFTGKFDAISFANNNLTGTVPPGLRNLPSSAFLGNPALCGPPLTACVSPSLSPPPSITMRDDWRNSRKKLNTLDIVLILVAGLVFLLLLVASCLLCYLRHHMKRLARSASSLSTMSIGGGGEKKKTDREIVKVSDDSKEDYSSAQEPEHNKLVFFQGGNLNFDLEDLLRASAEVLGKGSFGTAYKAVLEDGATVVVKRLKEVTASRKEFEQQMDSVGRLRHPNLVPLRAYYFSKEEKLLVHDYYPLGSLSALLHDAQRTELDWETRLKIALGAARGVEHIHGTSSKSVHGDIRSANVLLKGKYEACLSDYGMLGVFAPNGGLGRARPPALVGYRAPELEHTNKPTQRSDVYSFGVLLLELLTGKAPWQVSMEEGLELVGWVQSVVREEWTSEVFDRQLMKYEHIEEEMVELLQLGLACVAPSPEERPSMDHVVSIIYDVRPTSLQEISSPEPLHLEASNVASPPSSADDSSK